MEGGWLIVMGNSGYECVTFWAQHFLLKRNSYCMCRAACINVFMGVRLIKLLLRHISVGSSFDDLTRKSVSLVNLTQHVCLHACKHWPIRAPMSTQTQFSIVCQLELFLISSPRLLQRPIKSVSVCVFVCLWTVQSPTDKAWCDSTLLISLLDQTLDQCCCLLYMGN